MAAGHYLDYLGSVWGLLPTKDQERLGELWHGYEQVFAAVYQKFAEVDLNIAVEDLQAFETERWLPYEFIDDNFISRPAIITSTQDISGGLNLTTRYLLRFAVDGGSPIEVNVQGVNPLTTTIDEIIDKINTATIFKFARAIFENTIVQLTSPTAGANSSIELLPTSIPAANASEFILGISADDLPKTFPQFRFPYQMPYANVSSIPELQDRIRDEDIATTLVEGTDYVIEANSIITFAEQPMERLWARRTLINNETPWNTFGFLLGIYQPNSPRYVDVIQGLWFAFWNGPKPINVKTSLYLLFGLPTAQETSVVTAVSPTEVETTAPDGTVRTYEVPTGLDPAVTLGQQVERFTPLVTGIDVLDKISNPGFIAEEIGRAGIQRFLTEDASRGTGDTDETKALTMLEEYTFLPQITVDAFIFPDINITNVTIFLDAIKPLNKTYLFQVVVGKFSDEIVLEEKIPLHWDADLTPNVDSNETTFQDSLTLTDYETIDNNDLNLDPYGIVFQETVDVEVRSFGSLIDSFTI